MQRKLHKYPGGTPKRKKVLPIRRKTRICFPILRKWKGSLRGSIDRIKGSGKDGSIDQREKRRFTLLEYTKISQSVKNRGKKNEREKEC